ncbi:MAG: histidine decarboxylase [Theionarchaea archaeon]|nr:histidine decarboxylase [Theionarchaea archaeon]
MRDRLSYIILNCRNNQENYCKGYMEPGMLPETRGDAYISTVVLSTGVVKAEKTVLDQGLEGIVSYDRAEKNDAYIGEINMLQASSFTGELGAVWGLDLAIDPRIQNKTLVPVFQVSHKGIKIPVYPVQPLRDAARQLFGINDRRHFPFMHGSHVICAEKSYTTDYSDKSSFFHLVGALVWCSIGLAIAKDRSTHASLFVEDVGHYDGTKTEKEVRTLLDVKMKGVAEAIILCGEDQHTEYSKVFLGWKATRAEPGYVGCALTCAPYVTLPKNVFRNMDDPRDILCMDTDTWLNTVGLEKVQQPAQPNAIEGPLLKGKEFT